jgi:alpha-galactosidase
MVSTPVSTSAGIRSVTLGQVTLDLRVGPDEPVSLSAMRPKDRPDVESLTSAVEVPVGGLLVEAALIGESTTGAHASSRHQHHATSRRLRPETVDVDEAGSLLVRQRDGETGLVVDVRITADPGTGVLRWHTSARNDGDAPVTLTYLSSALVRGIGRFHSGNVLNDADVVFHLPHNAWTAEARWQNIPLPETGLADIAAWPDPEPHRASPSGSKSRVLVAAYGTWSTAEFLPMGALTLSGPDPLCLLWQIEHNGAWGYELFDTDYEVAVRIAGPTDTEHDWRQILNPGETFDAVPATTVAVNGSLDAALGQLTRSRRAHRRQHADHQAMALIFNDYMNCLNGDPTTAKLLPVIDAAADAGAEYFVIDAGWYADDGNWWETVGAWEPSVQRFPDGGLDAVIDHIKARGLVPGLWFEPEVVGVRSPMLGELPDEAYFSVAGKRIEENGRFQLDYRHPAVIERMDRIIDGLIARFDLGYFKFDYNINPGHGTDAGGVSRGAGLLGHNRAFLGWINRLFDRHPGLVLENCSSGGCRMEYGQLGTFTLVSTSDQTDPVRYAAIAAAVPSAAAPEQSATWAYPQPDWSDEKNALTMANAMMGRIHLSGRPHLMDDRQRTELRRATDAYKAIRHDLRDCLPSWPLGLPRWNDPWLALALTHPEGHSYLAVWHRGGPDSTTFDVGQLVSPGGRIEPVYPTGEGFPADWDLAQGRLSVRLPSAPSARLVRIVRG